MWFGLCEFLNIVSIVLSMGLCHWLLNYQFAFYGMRVIEYLGTPKKLNSIGQYVTHDPMCELFPTEVSLHFVQQIRDNGEHLANNRDIDTTVIVEFALRLRAP